MATKLKPIAHDARLSVVDHLDELRSRLLVCAATFAVAFVVCFAFNHRLLDAVNKPLKDSTKTAQTADDKGRLSKAANAQQDVQAGLEATQKAVRVIAGVEGVTAAEASELKELAGTIARAADALPKTTPEKVPVTLGVGEPFTVTLTVVAYFAILFSLPVLLYQLYAFVLPAFSPRERKTVLPLMAMVPFLFLGGVAFGYFLVLPPAISFLQNFNDTNFDVLLGAKDYYRFAMMALLSTGLVFQLPVGLLALNSVGILSAERLRASWRYAVVGIAVVAAILPGVDPVTTVILMVPLLLLFVLSILLLTLADRRRGSRGELADPMSDGDGETGGS